MDREAWQLGWIQRNQRRQRLPEPVGPFVAQAAEQVSGRARGWRSRIDAVLTEHLGPAWSREVVVASLVRGVLRLEVCDAAVLYQLRLMWSERLLALLKESAPGLNVRQVRFVPGR